jgi:hypothetical protein
MQFLGLSLARLAAWADEAAGQGVVPPSTVGQPVTPVFRFTLLPDGR